MELDILYTTDHKYAKITASSMLSLIMNNKNSYLRIHLIAYKLTMEDYMIFKRLIEENEGVELYLYDMDTYNISEYDIPSWRGTQVANARLFFQDIIETSNINKLLYLDSDTIILDDLSSLLEYDATISAVEESTLNYRLKQLNIDRYFNSGVILFDVCQWIEGDYQSRLINFRKQNPHMQLVFPDQDLLNATLESEINPLPYEYNIPPYAYATYMNYRKYHYKDKRKSNNFDDIEDKIKNPKIYHSFGFGGIKPWTENKVNPFNEEFEKYLELVNPNLNKEKLHGAKRILAEHKTLLYLVLYLKNCLLPEQVVKISENNILKRK